MLPNYSTKAMQLHKPMVVAYGKGQPRATMIPKFSLQQSPPPLPLEVSDISDGVNEAAYGDVSFAESSTNIAHGKKWKWVSTQLDAYTGESRPTESGRNQNMYTYTTVKEQSSKQAGAKK